MKLESIFSIGLQGIQRGMQDLSENASKVSRAFTPDSDTDAVESLIGIKLATHQVTASAKIIKAGEETFDSVLSILA